MLIYDVPHLILRPPESDALLPNPGKGMSSYQRFNGDPLTTDGTWHDRGPLTFGSAQSAIGEPSPPDSFDNGDYPYCSIAYFRWYWADIEPEQGKYRWDVIDHVLAEGEKRGQMVHIGIMPLGGPKGTWAVYRNLEQGPGVPDWYAEVAETVPDAHCSGNLLPIWDSPEYLEHYGGCIRALGARYNGHPNLFAVDVSILDWWGEGGGVCGGEAFQAETDRLIDRYVDSFPDTHLISLINGYQMRAGTRKGCGFRGDSLGDVTMHEDNDPSRPMCWNHMYNYYPMQVAQADAAEAWRQAPVVMEAGWVPNYWRDAGFPIDWIIQQALKYHVSTVMLKSAPIPEEWQDKIESFLKRMGYRFVLRQMMVTQTLKPGDEFWHTMWIENIGVARIYLRYRLAFRLRQDDKSEIIVSAAQPETWLPGDAWLEEKLPLPASLAKGTVDVDVGIVDADTLVPKVRFANEGAHDDGWLPMTTLEVIE
jgi:hypothetical protein